MVECGAVGTWMDESIARHAWMVEHPALGPVTDDLEMDIHSEKWKKSLGRCIFVCSLYSAAITASGILSFNY